MMISKGHGSPRVLFLIVSTKDVRSSCCDYTSKPGSPSGTGETEFDDVALGRAGILRLSLPPELDKLSTVRIPRTRPRTRTPS